MRKTTSNNFYENYFAPKKKVGKKRNRTKTFLIVFLCVILVVAIVVFAFAKANSQKVVFQKNAYLILVGKFDKIADAKDMADNVEVAGGAGYVWVEDTFWVIAFAYPSQKEAESVQKQLQTSGWDAVIEKKEIKKIKTKSLSSSQTQAINLLYDLLDQFYENALIVDKNEKSGAKVFSELTKSKKDVSLAVKRLQKSELDLLLQEKLSQIETELDDFFNSSFQQNLYSSGIKYLCIKTLFICVELFDEVQKLL